MRRLLGIALTLLIALSWTPAAVCAVRCAAAASPAGMAGMNRTAMRMTGMNMVEMVMATPAVGAVSCCSGAPTAMVMESAPPPAWFTGLAAPAAFMPPVQAASVAVSGPRRSAVPDRFLLPTSAVSPPLPLRI